MLGELLEARAVVDDEFLIVTSLGDDHVQHGEDERHVRSRLDWEPLVGFARGDREARVKTDQACLPVHRGIDEIHGVRRNERLEPVGAGHDDVVGVQKVERGDRSESG